MIDSSRRPLTLSTTLLVALAAGTGAGAATLSLSRLLADPAPADEPLARAPAPPTSAPAAGIETELSALRVALERAEAERSQLAGSLLALNRRNEALESRLASMAVTNAAAPAENLAESDPMLPSGEVGDDSLAGRTGEEAPRDRRQAELDSLLAAGLDPQSVEEIRRRRDGFELSRLELIDRATREGWRDDERFDREIDSLEENRPDLREELGDEAYDRYLYEQGGGNRVGVASVMSGSVAERAGLESGDVIVSYAGERMFRLRELQSATRGGNYGESVQLSVRRDGEVVAIEVPRGPLGVTLNRTRREPG